LTFGYEPRREYQCGCVGGHAALLAPQLMFELRPGPFDVALADYESLQGGIVCPRGTRTTQILTVATPPCLILSGDGPLARTVDLNARTFTFAGAIQRQAGQYTPVFHLTGEPWMDSWDPPHAVLAVYTDVDTV